MTYILTDGLSGFSLEILQPGLLLWDAIMSHTCGRGKEENPYLYSLPYFRIIPSIALSILIGMVYAVVAPLLLPFLIGYFYLGYIVYVNQVKFLIHILSAQVFSPQLCFFSDHVRKNNQKIGRKGFFSFNILLLSTLQSYGKFKTSLFPIM